MVRFYSYCPCQEARPALTEEDIQRVTEKMELDEMRKQYSAEKGCIIIKMWECERRKLYKTDMSVKEQLRESIPYKRPMRQQQFLVNTKSGAFFGYVQCNIKVPEHLREQFAKFPPLFQIYIRI